MISFMVYGCPDDSVRHLTRESEVFLDGETVKVTRPIEPGTPLKLTEAAIMCRVRLRNARELFSYPIFKQALASELNALRESEKARSLATVVEIRDDPGNGKAADRKVRLQAAEMILGEGEGKKSGTTVNVFNGTQHITAGIVIRPPRGMDLSETQTKVIEHENHKDKTGS
jgi:hypothetical protein